MIVNVIILVYLLIQVYSDRPCIIFEKHNIACLLYLWWEGDSKKFSIQSNADWWLVHIDIPTLLYTQTRQEERREGLTEEDKEEEVEEDDEA